MDFILLSVIILAFVGAKVSLRGGDCDTCLSRKQTMAVNGIFVLLVFLRHFKQYIKCGPYDRAFWLIDGYLDQLIVTTFLFYSGYGILVSLKNKKGYLKTIPKRICKVWLMFSTAVCLFLILNAVIGKQYSISRILLSFTAWQSVGNSNWYILAILILYFLSYIGGVFTEGNRLGTILFVSLGCLLYVVIMILCGKGSYYYSTIFCYPFGMLWGEKREQINTFLKKPGRYWIALANCAGAFFVSYYCAMIMPGLLGLAMLEVQGVFFVLLIILATMKIRIGNPVLDWLGKYTFELYILQRLPMIAFSGQYWNPYLYFGICLAVTCSLAVLYKKAVEIFARKYPVLQ